MTTTDIVTSTAHDTGATVRAPRPAPIDRSLRRLWFVDRLIILLMAMGVLAVVSVVTVVVATVLAVLFVAGAIFAAVHSAAPPKLHRGGSGPT